MAAARQQAQNFAREKFEVNITPKLDNTALKTVKERIEKTAGTVSVKTSLDRSSLQSVKGQIERTIGRVQVRTQLDRSSLQTVKAQIDRTIGRVQVRAQLDRATLQALRDRVNSTVGTIQARVTLDRESVQLVRERISNIRGVITARLRLDQESVTAVRKRISETIRPRLDARLNLDRDSIVATRERIAAMRPRLYARLMLDRDSGDLPLLNSLVRVQQQLDRTRDGVNRLGNDGGRAFRHMDGTVRAVLMTLPLLLPAAASAVTGLVGALGGVVSIMGVAGTGLAAWGGVAISVFSAAKDGAALTRTEIAKLPPGIREAAGALKTLQETWDALVKRTQAGVGQAMAAGFNAAAAAVRTLDPIINNMSKAIQAIGQDMQTYFGTSHWSTFVSFIANNVQPVMASFWEILKYLTRTVMDLTIAFMPLGQWILDRIAGGMKSMSEWAAQLAGNREFTQWLDLVKDSLTSVTLFLGSVIGFLFRLANALAPVGNIILDVLTMVFNGLSKLPPEWLAAIAMGIAGVFSALLLGAGGPVALAVGAVIGLAAAFASAYEHSKPFKDAIDSITGSISSGFLPIAAQVKSAWESQIKPAWDGMASAIRDNVLPVLQELGDKFGGQVVPAIGTLVEMLTTKAIPGILGFMEAAAPVVGFFVDVFGTAIVNAIEAVVRSVGGGLQAVGGIFQAFTGLFTGNWQTFWDGIKNIGEGILRAIVGIFGFSLDEFQGMLSGWGATISGAWNSAWQGISDFFTGIWDGIVNFITGTIPAAWDSLVTGVQNAIGAVGEWFAKLPENIGWALGYAIGTVIQWGIDLKNGMEQAAVAVLAWFIALPAKIEAAVSNAAAWLLVTGTNIIEGLKTGVTNGWNAFIQWWRDLPANIEAFFDNAGTWLLQTGIDILAGLINGIVSGYTAVDTWFRDLHSKIWAFFDGAPGWLSQAGSDILAGFLNGLLGAWTSVTNWISEFTAGFLQGIKDALGIASPSTVMAEIGGWVIQGFIDGVQAAWGAALAFFGGLWQGIVDIVRTSLSGIQSLVTTIVGGIVTAWEGFWNTVSAVANNIWNGLRNTWDAFVNGIRTIYNGFSTALQQAWQLFWNTIQYTAQAVWAAIQVLWNGFTTAIRQVYDAFAALFRGDWQGFWDGIRNAAQTIWNALQQAWNIFTTAIQNIYNTWSAWLTNVWNSLWNGIRTVAENVWNAITSFIDRALTNVQNIVSGAADRIGQIWRRVANFFRDPINWVIDVVINRGILGGWNTVMGWIGASSLQVAPLGMLPVFAKGGEVPLTPGARANRDSVQAMLMPGEYVFSKRAIANMGGLSVVDQIHQQARNGVGPTSPLANRSEGQTAQALMRAVPGMDGKLPHYAYGGVQPHVAAAGDAVVRALGPMPGGIGGVGSRPNASDHPGGLALDFMTLSNKGLQNRVADFLTRGWGQYGVKYLISNRRIANSPGAWTGMENRGSVTANHEDHVHASFLGEGGAGGGGGVSVSLWSIFGGQVESLFRSLLNFSGMPGLGSPIGDAITKIPGAMVGKVVDALRQKLENMFTTIFGGGGAVDTAGISGPVVDQVRQVAAQFGWDQGAEWNAIQQIVQKESSWNPNAANPTSSARGLFQKMTSIHGPVEPTPAGQAGWGLNYIRSRYGTPTAALRFHNANGYYDDGGWLMPGPSIFEGGTAINKTHKPEAVLTDEQWTGLLTGLNAITGGEVFGNQGSGEIVIAGIERLGNVMQEILELLERRGAAANIIVEDKSGSPVETARAARLALRLS